LRFQFFINVSATIAGDICNLFSKRRPKALLCILTPLRTAKCQFWIGYHRFASETFSFRLIFKELNGISALGTLNFKNVPWFPESLVLAGAFNHFFAPFSCVYYSAGHRPSLIENNYSYISEGLPAIYLPDNRPD
jgi:hypothetical protein